MRIIEKLMIYGTSPGIGRGYSWPNLDPRIQGPPFLSKDFLSWWPDPKRYL